MVMNRFNLEAVLDALEAVHREHGFVTYELVGDRVGLSRQAVQIGLRRHVDKGLVPASIYDKYWPSRNSKRGTKEVKFYLDPDTVDFIKNIALQLKVKPNIIVEAAIAHYRQHLKSTTTPSE